MADTFGSLSFYFVYVLLASTIGPLLFGFHLAELNAPSDVITCTKKSYDASLSLPSLPQCIPMTTFQFGLVSSIFTIGGFFGAVLSGPLAAKYGRLTSMKYNTLFLAAGPIAESCATSVASMAFGRLISGVGAGVALVTTPLYISEISPPNKKGFFGAFTQVMINVGILIAQTLGLFLSRGKLWRIILGVGGIIGLSQFGALIFAVESPKWSADHGRTTEARKALQKIRGNHHSIIEEVSSWGVDPTTLQHNEEEALLEHNDDRSTPIPDRHTASYSKSTPSSTAQARANEDSIGLFAVLTHPTYNKAVAAVVIVMLAQQLCGINSIVMYGVSLLADLLASSSATLNVAVAGINVFMTALCAPLPDRIGRKKCLLYSIAGMGTSSLILAIAILKHVPVLSAISVLTFVASFAVGLGPVPFILSSELVGAEAVGATQSWALGANWAATFVVAQFFPIVNEALGKGKVYFIFAALAAMFASFVLFMVPETLGKSSADEVWGRRVRRPSSAFGGDREMEREHAA